jgi:hypothetical protein
MMMDQKMFAAWEKEVADWGELQSMQQIAIANTAQAIRDSTREQALRECILFLKKIVEERLKNLPHVTNENINRELTNILDTVRQDPSFNNYGDTFFQNAFTAAKVFLIAASQKNPTN